MVGAVARAVHRKSPERARALVAPLEEELGHHSPDRYRRQTDGVTLEPPTEKEFAGFARTSLLLEALGNAGNHGSLPRLLSHATADDAPLPVRHAAVHALRTFDTPEVEMVLLERSIMDTHDHVRKVAMDLYTARPRSLELADALQSANEVRDLTLSNVTLAPAGPQSILVRQARGLDSTAKAVWKAWMKARQDSMLAWFWCLRLPC